MGVRKKQMAERIKAEKQQIGNPRMRMPVLRMPNFLLRKSEWMVEVC